MPRRRIVLTVTRTETAKANLVVYEDSADVAFSRFRDGAYEDNIDGLEFEGHECDYDTSMDDIRESETAT